MKFWNANRGRLPAMQTRILIVTRNLPPLLGGMERLNWHMAEELAKRADVRVIGPEGAANCAPAGVSVDEVRLRPLWWFLLAAQWAALRQAHAWRPQVVLAGSGLTAPLAWLAAKACGARSAVYVHGLDLAVRHSIYRMAWHPAIRRMHHVIANSRATAKLAMGLGVDCARIGIVHPGVALPPENRDVAAVKRFRSGHDLGDRPILLSVGRLTQRKGLREFVSQVLPTIAAQQPNVLLLVIGGAAGDALHAESQTPASIQAAADAAGVGKNIKFLGVITNRDLAMAYQSACVHVFPVQQIPNDPEGFGMVAVEAAVYGLPTVAYATGGVVDAVSNGVSGYLAPPEHPQEFATCVLKLLRHPMAVDGLIEHAKKFAWPRFGEHLNSHLFAEYPIRGKQFG